ncbi:HAD family phosphatase [Niabella yanshanensis]|uniref:HAD family phosphatase n=1 Tax=Niabella yanshanensis TaxID=577386 RepID=A0ABZ0W1E4_9BACT|nr:HAD family phosphatase [Niabella yanshanensis]WQD36544.1 HAD family phosphatase [Niabella yanshanensis]
MIKNILFDFGGVFYDLDFSKTSDAFKALGFSDFDSMFTQYQADALFQQLETGAISPELFFAKVQTLLPGPVTNEQIRDAWNALLLGYRQNSLAYLAELKKDYQLFLLSNTNQIHYDYFSAQLLEQTTYPSLESFFTKAYYSQQVGLRKPDIEVFEFILKDAGIKADETLFIDDSYTNFPNAEKLGMKIYLLKPGMLIEDIDYKSFH